MIALMSSIECTPCLKKTVKIVFVRTSTNCDNFWHKDGKEAKIIVVVVALWAETAFIAAKLSEQIAIE